MSDSVMLSPAAAPGSGGAPVPCPTPAPRPCIFRKDVVSSSPIVCTTWSGRSIVIVALPVSIAVILPCDVGLAEVLTSWPSICSGVGGKEHCRVQRALRFHRDCRRPPRHRQPSGPPTFAAFATAAHDARIRRGNDLHDLVLIGLQGEGCILLTAVISPLTCSMLAILAAAALPSAAARLCCCPRPARMRQCARAKRSEDYGCCPNGRLPAVTLPALHGVSP